MNLKSIALSHESHDVLKNYPAEYRSPIINKY